MANHKGLLFSIFHPDRENAVREQEDESQSGHINFGWRGLAVG